MASTLQVCIDGALEELRERVAQCEDDANRLVFLNEPHDTIHEIADGSVPVYNATLLAVAAESNEVALLEPEIGPAFDGTPTPINIIAANIFEAIKAELWEEAQRIVDEMEEEQSDSGPARKGEPHERRTGDTEDERLL
ncbi:hypothetical protein LCGC14_1635380 [marine sediment metagenome]|uniref:Uncharacterized protein n=1 Tax=marine sediment metagenome TaxID=412755 RepID=A0A0F9KGY4_9ZZZZ